MCRFFRAWYQRRQHRKRYKKVCAWAQAVATVAGGNPQFNLGPICARYGYHRWRVTWAWPDDYHCGHVLDVTAPFPDSAVLGHVFAETHAAHTQRMADPAWVALTHSMREEG